MSSSPGVVTSQKASTTTPNTPYVHDYGEIPWYQSRTCLIISSVIFFTTYISLVIWLSIVESVPVTGSPTKAPTLGPGQVAPVSIPDPDPVQLACNFLNRPTVSNCQALTEVSPPTVVTDKGITIPSELSTLTALTLLNLTGAGLIGSVPSSLAALTNLEALILVDNNMEGNIPDSICEVFNVTVDCGEIGGDCVYDVNGTRCP